MKKVYLDYASHAPICSFVLQHIKDIAESFYNPNSQYELGLYNMHEIEKVREKFAEMINADRSEIIFTRCASESNALAIDGFLKKHPKYSAVCTNIEHASIFKNPNITEYIKCKSDGFVDIDSFKGYKNTIFSVIAASNETGLCQPIEEISKEIHKNNNYLHVDATALFPHQKIDVKKMNVDMMTISSQKFGNIIGCGILYVKNGTELSSIIHGEQENGLIGGTYSAIAIKLAGLALDSINYSNETIIRERRDILIDRLLSINGVHLNGSIHNRLSNNINIRIDNLSIDNQQLVALLDLHGFMVSTSSACRSGEKKPSHVLKAMKLTDKQVNSSIRITIGIENSSEDLENFADCLNTIVNMNRI